VGDPEHTVFIPAYDVQSLGLHPKKKREHGWRAAKWALSRVYQLKGIQWRSAKLISAERQGDVMVLTFDGRVKPDDGSGIPRGFSIAGEDGKFYMAHARYQGWEGQSYWTHGHRTIHIWSPLVEKPFAVRYGWAGSPMGNLKCDGDQDVPVPSFRTDSWDLPESDDPEVILLTGGEGNARKEDAANRLEYRRTEEAKRAVEMLERLKTLGQAE
jgi:sialate O-acetylesterase